MSKTVVYQAWIETERGWGERSDGYSLHCSMADRDAYVKAYWARMPAATPDEYSYPTNHQRLVDVPDDVYAELPASPNGIRGFDHPDWAAR